MRKDAAARKLARIQGAYFIATGVWPILHLRSFEAITGPKLEGWLVKMVGALAATIGATLLLAGRRERVSQETPVLALTSAAAFAAVDLWYAGARRRISPIYLGDGIIQAGFVGLWAALARNRRAQADGVRHAT